MLAVNFSVSAGFNINCRDIATGQTALHVALCDLEFDDDDDDGGEHGGGAEGGKGEGGLGGSGSAADRLVNACRFLLDRGADPLLADDKGNTALHYACHLNGLLGPLRLFLRRLGAANQQRRALQPNAFGNSPLHYALQQPMEDAEDAAVVAALMRTEGAADAARQPNLMGLTPPQLFRPSTAADPAVKRKVAALLGMTEAELLDVSTPTRPRVDRRRVPRRDAGPGGRARRDDQRLRRRRDRHAALQGATRHTQRRHGSCRVHLCQLSSHAHAQH